MLVRFYASFTYFFYSCQEFSDEISRRIPEPDLNSMESSLRYLKQNINRALPNTRLESKTDSMAFSRVSTHLHAFKKTLFDQVKALQFELIFNFVVELTFFVLPIG